MSDNQGNVVPGSIARYLPFGDWRRQPTADLTDIGFTGHKSNNVGNNDIGLIYMNARFYLPNTNRFISADTIVPNPTNPQSWNRYSYGYNNPLRYTDPTGHCGAEGNIIDSWNWDSSAQQYVPTYSSTYQDCITMRDQLGDQYGWIVEGQWFLADIQTLLNAGHALENWFRNGGSLNPQEVIRNVFRGTSFHYADTLSLFRLTGDHHVWGTAIVMLENFSLDSVIHELGHVLDNVVSGKTWLGGSAVWGSGLSDQFAKFIGMTGYEGCWLRFECGGSYSGPAWDDHPDPAVIGTYWKKGPSEDFAQAFRYSVLYPQDLSTQSPARAQFLNLIRSGLVDYND
jgi:RHS repeat-associated protein